MDPALIIAGVQGAAELLQIIQDHASGAITAAEAHARLTSASQRLASNIAAFNAAGTQPKPAA